MPPVSRPVHPPFCPSPLATPLQHVAAKANPAWWRISQGCVAEAFALGLAQNITFSFDDPDEFVSAFVDRMPHARPSMLLDHYAGRRSEIDAINGMAVELGQRLGIPTPYNEVISAMVRRKEEAFS